MGLCHSGYVADILLFNMCERVLVNPRTLQNFGTDGFWRFKDDILILGTDREQKAENSFVSTKKERGSSEWTWKP
jgi:hypothetical protein